MKVDPEVMSDVTSRLRRVEGQIGGLLRMIEEGRDCAEVVTQLAAARGLHPGRHVRGQLLPDRP